MTHLEAGARVNQFEIVRTLGEGGFGITYLALDTALNKEVALKEYFPVGMAGAARRGLDGRVSVQNPSQAAQFEQGLEKYIEEARMLARFEHPNIVRVLNFLRENGTAYMVMQYVRGETLEDYLRRKRSIPVAQLRLVLENVAEGLREAHRFGVLHRDVKPSNIQIALSTGECVLIDFGAARQSTEHLSRPLSAIVTPGFAPYEQYLSLENRQGPWSDIYAMCATGYYALTQKLPPDALSRQEQDTYAPLSEQDYDDPLLVRAINAGLARDWNDRPASIDEWLAIAGLATAPAGDGGARADGTVRIERRSGGATEKLDIDGRPESAVAWPAPPPKARQAQTRKALAPRWALGAVVAALVLGVGAITASSFLAPGSAGEAAAALEPLSTFADCTDECPQMVVMPQQSFVMGENDDVTARKPNELPARTMRISARYAISSTEVTVGQWMACVRAGACGDPHEWNREGRALDPLFEPIDLSDDRYPITSVPYAQINVYLSWLSRTTGRQYRLPSEAEWEFAARGGAATTYPWGDDARPGVANCTECRAGVSREGVQPVRNYWRNAFGLYDMQGNAWELTGDCWTENVSSVPADGSLVRVRDCSMHVVKGGGWNSGYADLRPARREAISVAGGDASIELGFRVAVTLD